MGFNRLSSFIPQADIHLTYCLKRSTTLSVKLLSFIGKTFDSTLFFFVRYRSCNWILMSRCENIRFVAAIPGFDRCSRGDQTRRLRRGLVVGEERWSAHIGSDLVPNSLAAWDGRWVKSICTDSSSGPLIRPR
jgi:hypothetical protein